MPFNNEFLCPDGHKFNANAKIRARCPDCGKMARRNYAPKETSETSVPEVVTGGDTPAPPVTTTTEEPPVTKGVKLLRQGKPRSVMPKKVIPPKDASGKFVSSKTVKKPIAKAKTNAGLVTKRSVSAGTKKKPTIPKVVKRPPRTAIARHIANERTSYADQMIGQYGIRRS